MKKQLALLILNEPDVKDTWLYPCFKSWKRLFGEVFKCRKDEQTYAIKKLIAYSAISKEVRSHRGLSHTNVVKYIDSFSEEGFLWIVLEYCSGGNLNTYMLRQQPDQATLLGYIRQVLSGVEYLHSKEVLHRDIKPDNLMKNHRTLKIADFGLARVWELSNSSVYYSLYSQRGFGPRYYTAPEVQIGNITVDIFSVGCMIIAMFSRTTVPWSEGKKLLAPYIDTRNSYMEISDATEKQKKDYVEKLADLTGEEKKIVLTMVKHNWRDRPTVEAAKESFKRQVNEYRF